MTTVITDEHRERLDRAASVPLYLQLESVLRGRIIEPGQRVRQIRRVRVLADAGPISLHVSYLPERLVPVLGDEDLNDRQLCVILEDEYGLRMARVSETLESTLATPQDVEYLQVTRETPLLLLAHEVADPSGCMFEYSRILFRGDKIRLQFRYNI